MITATEILKDALKNHIIENESIPNCIVISYHTFKGLKSDFEKDKPKEICKTECKDITFMGLYIHIDDNLTHNNVKFIYY